MRISPTIMALFVLSGIACSGDADPLSDADARYTEIMVGLAKADRDSTRNIRNRDARRRKVDAENARSAFFKSKAVQTAFEEAKASDAPEVLKKLKAYDRHKLIAVAWTDEEKKEETRLLTRLDELNGVEATWTSQDGKHEIALGSGWRHASKAADDLTESDRSDLAANYIEHRMRVVGPDLQALVNLRNTVAKRVGYDNYWELGLASQGLTPKEVDTIIAELTPVVQPLMQETAKQIQAKADLLGVQNTFANRMMIRRAMGLETGRDEADHFFDADLAEERVREAFRDMGIPTEGWQVYSGPSRYTRSGVYGFPIRPPASVAIVMSNDRRWTMWQYEAISHEGGHAVWWQGIDGESAKSPPLWEPTHPWFEGFAGFFERLVYEPGFHARYVPELPKPQREAVARWRARSVVTSIASGIVQTEVERRLYEDPNSLEAVTRFAANTRAVLTGVTDPPVTESGLTYDNSLLSSILWTYPAYSQNYLFSAMTEAWMWEAVETKIGNPIGNPKVGELLKNEIIRADKTLVESLTAMRPGKRTDALKTYLETATVDDKE